MRECRFCSLSVNQSSDLEVKSTRVNLDVAVAHCVNPHYLFLTRRAFAAALLLHLAAEVCDSQSLTQADFANARRKLVEEEIAAPDRGITNQKVLEVMGSVPRHEFVPESQRHLAYRDEPLPIGYGQTISQPSLVAFMPDKSSPRNRNRFRLPSRYSIAISKPCLYHRNSRAPGAPRHD